MRSRSIGHGERDRVALRPVLRVGVSASGCRVSRGSLSATGRCND
ncbi:hypothetical protein ACFSEO_07740 [Agromyces cerinus subsp. nitratus]